MSSPSTVSIISPSRGRKNFIANDVPVEKLIIYSRRYSPKGLAGGLQLDIGKGMNEEFARTIAVHIKNSDSTNPAPISLDLFGKDRSLEELVQIWRVIGHGFKAPRERHDETIRQDLRLKIYRTTPFTFADFKLIAENVAFDRGLVHSCMDRVTFLHIKGFLDEETKMAVENYCKDREGWWDMLLETVGRVETKINNAADEKEARNKAKQEKAAREANKLAEKAKAQEAKKKSGGGIANKGNGNKGSGGKAKKAKAQKPAAPFVHNDGDFPPLA